MARNFDSTNDFLLNLNPIFSGLPITIHAKFKHDNGFPPIVDKVIFYHGIDGGGFRFRLLLEGSSAPDRGTIRWVSTENFSNARAQTTGIITENIWQTACGVEAATNDRRVYLNGTNKGTNSTTKDPFKGNTVHQRISIGAEVRSGGVVNDLWEGDLGHIAAWSAALTDDEVLGLETVSPLRMRRDSLVYYCPIGGQSPEQDIIGGLDMTINSSPVQVEEPPVPWGVVAPG